MSPILLLILLYTCTRVHAFDLDDPVVNTECGPVQGTKTTIDGGLIINQFLGLRYGAPVNASSRWTMSKGVVESGFCFDGTFVANKFGSKCAQQNLLKTGVDGTEDCLFLNIYSPSLTPTKLMPVLFYIHGGGLMGGSGGDSYAVMDVLSANISVVSVTVNYRLSAFGFMALDALTQNSNTNSSGNYGFGDQLLALSYVRSNIRAFGGDPSMITVVGQSSGATSIYALLSSTKIQVQAEQKEDDDDNNDDNDNSKEGAEPSLLFKSAWLMSPSPLFEKTLKEASKDNEIFIKNAGCSNAPSVYACLMALTTEQVVAAVPYDVYPYWSCPMLFDFPLNDYIAGGIAIVDGYIVPDKPTTIFSKPGLHNHITTVWGNMREEIDTLPTTRFSSSNVSGVHAFLSERIGNITQNASKAGELVKMYDEYVVNMDAQQLYESISSDVGVMCGLNSVARSLVQSSAMLMNNKSSNVKSTSIGLTYRYIVNSHPLSPVSIVPFVWSASHAFHLFDLLSVTGKQLTPLDHLNQDVAAQRLGAEMRQHVKSVVQNDPIWADFSQDENVWVYDPDGSHTESFFKKEICDFWSENGFDRYAWVN